ncbi:MAG TPA: VTT domain-containing protein, partial [Xanthobacteraceae bacterium]|nr:VTT domain-containing protein [Xanthobacteraceae bacterium]
VRRLSPLAMVAVAMVVVYAGGWYREVSLENLIRHRAAIDLFVDEHCVTAIGVFIAVYVVSVAMSIPGAVLLTVAGGALFGWLAGGLATIVGATLGAMIIFEIARTACGGTLVRRAGPRVGKLAEGFRENAFSYLLFLRLVPVFPFFLVNIAPALVGVGLGTFVAATVIGIIPATFAFAMFGAGLDSIVAAQESVFRACIAAGRTDCHLDFDRSAAITPQLVAAVVALSIVALVPVVIRRWRAVAGAAARPALGAQASTLGSPDGGASLSS